MKILVVSHNVFSEMTNMGKTLKSYFQGVDNIDISQFYIHSEIPTDSICSNYYRITDRDAIKSIFTRKSGSIFTERDVKYDEKDPRVYSGHTEKLYQRAQSKSPAIYFIRNLWWSLGVWKTKKLLSWINKFDPDVVFFASGDYAFMYKIALTIAKYKNIPLIVSCMDDYYFYNRNAGRFGGNMVHSLFMKQVNKTMSYSSLICAICEKMGKEYGEFFNKPYHIIHTPASIPCRLNFEKNKSISYIGNLGYKRNEQIVAIGKALKNIKLEDKPEFIDVYSAEKRPEILKDLTEENGIRFHGSISSDKVIDVIGQSLGIIHTESFDKDIRRSVAYSVSTKIADSLASGTCIFAYGPEEIASMKYLMENGAAFCVTEEKSLQAELEKFLADDIARRVIADNACRLSEKNHDSKTNCSLLLNAICSIR